MNKHGFFCCLFVAMVLLSTFTKTDAQSQPNVVIIFTDDQGYGDIGCFGATGFETPNLDRLASQGMMFTNFYAAQAVCSASRAGLMTGCYPNRIGISGALFPYHEIGLNPSETTIAEIFKSKGYATAAFGKWHLGHHKKFLPLQHGFDKYLGLPYSNDMWPVNFDGTKKKEGKRRSNYPVLPLIEDNEKIDELSTLEDMRKLTTLYTEKAIDFIDRNKETPFFLYVPHTMPHVPLGVSGKFDGKTEKGMYGDVIEEIDWSVGEILKALERNGLSDNTLVVFTTDNGPWLNFGDHAGSAGGLREGKLTTWDGGQRVPCIMRWPGVIPEGTTCNKLASTLDLLPTVAGIINADLPEEKIDGVNILPLMTGNKDANPRETILYYLGANELRCVRKGNWKLVLPHSYESYELGMPRNGGFPGKRVRVKVDSMMLFNMMRDPGERNNVIDMYPEKLQELLMVVESAREDLGDKLTGRKGNGTRPVGTLQK
ncbi:MAG: sulfatase-like hydrolase/transferase [Bacteroidetes bacterium]|nr:sulfatase-like hydrolase/transferase [Bacteroidota bacterium]